MIQAAVSVRRESRGHGWVKGQARQSRGMHQTSEYAYGWTLPSDLDQRRHIGLGS